MYDIHCHVLPGVDDGAKDMSDSMEMCRAASDEGIKIITATPHYIEGELQVDAEKILSHVFLINQELKSEDINLVVLPGMEVFITPNLINLYKEGKIIPINCKNYIMIELPLYNSFPYYVDEVLFNLQIENITPVIAHPERCKIINDHPNLVYELIKKGCIMQVNSGSIEGLFGKDAQNTAYKLLEHNMVHVIASDGHSSQGRSCKLKTAYEIISKKFDSLLSEELFVDNPYKIMHGNALHIKDPIRIKKKKFWII